MANHVERLNRAVAAIATNNHADAERMVSELFIATRDRVDPSAVVCSVFGAALARRLSPAVADEANLYLSRFEVPQIRLFNLLANEVPQVALTTVIANRSIARALQGQAHPTVIDVGIGTGRQMTSLFELLRSEDQLPDRLTLIGIEPSDWSLGLAQDHVRRAAERLGFELDFLPICRSLEHLTREDWSLLAERCPGRPVINGSFAFHHISDVGGRDVRDDVLLRLRSLDPLQLVLAEPDVHHLEGDFARRFANCWQHFGSTFRVIDALPIPERDKNALKVSFFGREIADILGSPEATRSERHESTSSWLSRLRATGFRPCLDVELPPSGPVIAVTARDGYATLDYEDEPLVAVLAAELTDGPFDVAGALARVPS